MLELRAFDLNGPTVLVVAAVAAPLGVQVPSNPDTSQFRIVNDGTATAFYAFGETAAEAQANAVIPLAGVPKRSMPLPGGAIEIVTGPRDGFFSAATAAGTANVYVSPGKGL